MKIINTLALLAGIFVSSSVMAQNITLLTGTYTGAGKGEGIYVYDFNTKTGIANLRSVTKNIINPSYLTLSPDKKFIYSVNEDGAKSAASAFSYNAATKQATFLNRVAMAGKDPCYLIADDKNVITANYSSGDITVYPRLANGKLGTIKQVVTHTGSGKIKDRQASAHAHMVYFSPDKKYILSNDLGTDKIYVYKYTAGSTNPLTLAETVDVAPGAGPRHLTFSTDGKMIYLIGELDGKIYTYSYNNGKLTFKQAIATAPPHLSILQWGGADIHLSPDGKFLYASLRAEQNTISIFSVGKTGSLKYVDRASTLGTGPRNFAITPDGNWLLAAHQNSNNVVVFKRNKTTGALTDSGKRIEVGSPVCLVFF